MGIDAEHHLQGVYTLRSSNIVTREHYTFNTLSTSFINNPEYLDSMKRLGGTRRKSRYKMTKSFRRKGKISISQLFQTFTKGDKVTLSVEPAVQKGFYHPRFMGKTGIIGKKKGRCYEVTIQDNKEKTLIVHPVHLKRS